MHLRNCDVPRIHIFCCLFFPIYRDHTQCVMTCAMQNCKENTKNDLNRLVRGTSALLQRSMTVGVVADDAKRNNDLEPKWLRII